MPATMGVAPLVPPAGYSILLLKIRNPVACAAISGTPRPKLLHKTGKRKSGGEDVLWMPGVADLVEGVNQRALLVARVHRVHVVPTLWMAGKRNGGNDNDGEHRDRMIAHDVESLILRRPEVQKAMRAFMVHLCVGTKLIATAMLSIGHRHK